MIDSALIEIRDLLQTNMGARCEAYYAGDIGIPAKSALPAIIIREKSMDIDRSSTAKDVYKFSIGILVVTHLTAALSTAGLTDHVSESRQTLRKLIAEKDTDGAPKTNTVIGALMKQSSLVGSNYAYSLNPHVNFEIESPDGHLLVAAEVTLDVMSTLVARKA